MRSSSAITNAAQLDVLVLERLDRAIELPDDEVEPPEPLLLDAPQLLESAPALAMSRNERRHGGNDELELLTRC